MASVTPKKGSMGSSTKGSKPGTSSMLKPSTGLIKCGKTTCPTPKVINPAPNNDKYDNPTVLPINLPIFWVRLEIPATTNPIIMTGITKDKKFPNMRLKVTGILNINSGIKSMAPIKAPKTMAMTSCATNPIFFFSAAIYILLLTTFRKLQQKTSYCHAIGRFTVVPPSFIRHTATRASIEPPVCNADERPGISSRHLEVKMEHR